MLKKIDIRGPLGGHKTDVGKIVSDATPNKFKKIDKNAFNILKNIFQCKEMKLLKIL